MKILSSLACAVVASPNSMIGEISETSCVLELNSLNLAVGRGFVKISAMFSDDEMYLICRIPFFTTSPQNFNRTSMCLVHDLDDLFPTEEIAG